VFYKMVMNNNFLNNMNKVVNAPQKNVNTGNRLIKQNQSVQQNEGSFASILQQKSFEQKELKFSKHAEQRMQQRNISFSGAQMERLLGGVSKASEKGVRDSLVVVDDVAVVVNIPNRVVVTAANSSELKESVFTNIDGAVFA